MSGVIIFCSIVGLMAIGWPRPRPRRVSPPDRRRAQSFERGQRALVSVVAFAAVAVVLGPLTGVVLALSGGIGWWWHGRLARARDAVRLRAALADAIDLIAAVLGAGGSVRQAFAVLESQGPVVLQPALARAGDHRAAGVAFAGWSEAFLAEAGEEYRPLVRALLATERDGAPVATLLERLADESRRARADEREVAAKRLPLLLLGPLVACSLPAVLIGSVIPLVLVALGAVDLG